VKKEGAQPGVDAGLEDGGSTEAAAGSGMALDTNQLDDEAEAADLLFSAESFEDMRAHQGEVESEDELEEEL
jgi:hypothetical protein